MIDESRLNRIIAGMVDNKRVFSAVLKVENGDGSFSWTGSAGQMQTSSRYFIASVTKLYVTAVIISLIDEKKLLLSDTISKFLPDSICNRLNILKGTDYSSELTVKHLISNTSGLPDYFFHKLPGGGTVASELMSGKDEAWPLDRTIELVKQLQPKFAPGAKGKAAYSDTNYQLLGRIIENLTGKTTSEVFHTIIFSKLNFKDTYFYSDTSDTSPVPYYYKGDRLWLPNYMASVGVEGGIVSTAAEVMRFAKAFFQGNLFPKETINELKQWNIIFPPPGLFFFGIGLEKLWTPWFISSFKPIREILGFWGQTGSFAFHHPETDLYFCGTTNQINGAGHRAASSAMIKIIKSA